MNNENIVLNRINFNPNESLTIGALHGDTHILDTDGNLHNLEELACEYKSTIPVTCLDKHGRMTTTIAHSFRIGEWTDRTIKITLDNGHTITATANQQFLTANNEWVKASDLNFGKVLCTATYNTTMKHPLKTINEISHIHTIKEDIKNPTYSFNVNTYSNLLIAHEISNNIISLVPAHAGIPQPLSY